jgi:GT2 family glycosyltransferase
MFAIAMPAYNAESTLGDAVDSVIAQTFGCWELVVVDDGSTDRTPFIADAYAARDSRIRVVHQANAGCGPARSVAIDNSVCPYIVHFDSDDVLLPSCLEEYARFISDHPAYDIYSCNAEIFGQSGLDLRFYSDERFNAVTEVGLEEMLDKCLIVSAAAVFTRDIYRRAGGIRPEAHTEDYDLWLRAMAVGGRHIFSPQVLVRYRMGPSQMTASAERILDGTAESLRHLAASGLLDIRLTGLARRSARRYAYLARRHRAALSRARAAVAREELESRLCRGDLRDARREFLRVRLAYTSAAKFAVATPVALASPWLYAACLRRIRHRRAGSSAAGGRQ